MPASQFERTALETISARPAALAPKTGVYACVSRGAANNDAGRGPWICRTSARAVEALAGSMSYGHPPFHAMLQLASQRNLAPIPRQSSHLSEWRSVHRRLITPSGPIRAPRSRLVQEVMMPRNTIDPNN